jgi:methyltransferase
VLRSRRGDLVLVAVGVLAAQRLGELALSRRHERTLRDAGAVEAGAGHYPLMVVLHASWLAATALEARLRPARRPGVAALAAGTFVAAQGLRYWAIATLGPRWTTRIIVPADEAPVTTGPYRWLQHPNYVAVILEIASFPLVLGAPRTAAAGSAANAALLAVRIRAEDAALGRRASHR